MPGADLLSPTSVIPGDQDKRIENGFAICLSGGGYRAMLFHTGVLWRLIELGLMGPSDREVLLPSGVKEPIGSLKRVSSVSGGSIISAMLGLKWKSLDFHSPATLLASYKTKVVAPIRKLAGVTIAAGTVGGAFALLKKIVAPGSVSHHVAAAYDKHLFGRAKLNELPSAPRWVINASNLQSGALWRFMAPYMRDWKVGEIRKTGKVSIAEAVAASSAFPPVLAPATLAFDESDFTANSGGQGEYDLQRKPFTTAVSLADGGVYDNLGLETAYKRYRTLLVSDAGAPFAPAETVGRDWARLSIRVVDVMDNQVRALRKRLLHHSFAKRDRLGAFWDIDADIQAFAAPGKLPCPHAHTLRLARIDTDLGAKDDTTQERLINWGYAVCDASVRSYLDTSLPAPAGFAYPASGVG
jgi:NTE family protein